MYLTESSRLEHADSYIKAAHIITTHQQHYLVLIKEDPTLVKAATAALSHITYLHTYWLNEGMWSSWSLWGLSQAAMILNRRVDSLKGDTNVTESFNRLFKRAELDDLTHNGHRLRVDVAISMTIMVILPNIDRQYQSKIRGQQDIAKVVASQFPGGENLLAARGSAPSAEGYSNPEPFVGYFSDPSKSIEELQESGPRIYQERWQHVIKTLHLASEGEPHFTARYLSSRFSARDPLAIWYKVRISSMGSITCSCPQQQSHDGACKHLLDFRDFLLSISTHFPQAKQFFDVISDLPTTRKEALARLGSTPVDDDDDDEVYRSLGDPNLAEVAATISFDAPSFGEDDELEEINLLPEDAVASILPMVFNGEADDPNLMVRRWKH